MTCQHRPDDRKCSSYKTRLAEAERFVAKARGKKRSTTLTPNKNAYRIDDVRALGNHLVLRVRYPNCSNCAFEGAKVLVFLDVDVEQALLWRKIDPHFRDPDKKLDAHAAPSPAARFPATDAGWTDALEYASRKGKVK